MKLSVAMCTYNGARYLREQLESVATQTRLPDELIICDDCSDDATDSIVRHFAAESPFPVRFQSNEKRLGSTKNFEQAISLCEGEIIVLADQDDVWRLDKLALLEAGFENRSGVGCVFSDGEVVDENLSPLGWRVWQLIRFGQKEQNLFNRGLAFDVLLDHNVVTGATMAFRAKFREMVLPIPSDLIHDGIPVLHDGWTALMIAAVADLVSIPEPLIKYRQHAQQQLGVRSGLPPKDEAPLTNRIGALQAAAHRSNSFATEVHYLKTIYERLSSKVVLLRNKEVLSKLKVRIKHLEARAEMPNRLLSRLSPVLRELFTLRYHLYSKGISSAVKDLYYPMSRVK